MKWGDMILPTLNRNIFLRYSVASQEIFFLQDMTNFGPIRRLYVVI
jgi:hypothetical protein